jgi:hypothetical protein
MNIQICPKEYERMLNWYDGMMYCQLLVIDNKNDWRLPTKDELNEIYNSENDFGGSDFWSSTEYDGGYAWVQNMSDGNQYDYYGKDYSFYVRAVRSI